VRSRLLLVSLVAFVPLLLAGCGSKSLADKADDVCRDLSSRTEGLKKSEPNALTRAQKGVGVSEESYAKLAAIKPEAGKRADYSHFLARLREEVDRVKTIVAAAQGGDVARARTLIADDRAERDKVRAELKPVGQRLGFKQCIKP
jgi:outer membrane murein-binding lipoprotein Lpp